MSQSKNWSPELDGLRGYASLWVLLGHICILTQCNIPLLSNPDLGVDLFILLSGYLMAKNYIERRHFEPWNSLKTMCIFWIRRFFRIAPLYYILLIFAFSFGELFGHFRDNIASAWPLTQTETSRYADSSFLNIITHYSFLFGFMPYYSFRTVLPDWSIGLEMQYYAVFPFIMLLITRLGFIYASITMILLCIISSCFFLEYFSAFEMPSMILFKLPLFISGMLIYKAVSESKKMYVLTALLSPVTAYAMGYFISPIRMVIECFLIIGMAMLLMPYDNKCQARHFVKFIRKILSLRLSQFLGDVSYSVYLLHLMIVIPVIGILVQYTDFLNLASPMRFILSALISLPFTYCIALNLFKYVERNGIILGRKIIRNALDKS
ncbi:acyltransferase family protein [Klebsiella pneumoniae]|uniref:acyltransferase family protein n=1 Tax=Klebsiella pneumoniae TaxID=573 RepID=UPI0038D24F52|nr:acyltransferase [Klebsiella pneumoniae]